MDDPEVYEIKQGGGCLILLGLPFLAMGLAMMFGPLSIFLGKSSSAGRDIMVVAITMPIGLLVAGVGAWLVFGRNGTRLDRRERRIVTWWNLLGYEKRNEFDWNRAKHVAITAETRRSKNSTYTVYPVRIAGDGGMKINIQESQSYDQSRAKAEEIAKFLGLGVHDASSGQVVVREAGRLDESLQERAARTGRLPDPPVMPPNCRILHRVEGDEASFELPKDGPGCAAICVCVAVLSGAVFALSFWPPSLVIAIIALLLAGPLTKSALTRETAQVSSRVLRVVRRSPFGTKVQEIPAGELEEFIDQKNCIVARSDELTISFGNSLNTEERAWLHGVANVILSSGGRI